MSQSELRPGRQPTADLLLSASLLACLILLLGAAGAVPLGLGLDFVLREAVLYGVAVAVLGLAFVVRGGGRFGAANRITLLRLALLALVAASLGESPGAALSWAIIGVTTTALILDGCDGFVARKSQTASAFGARFDMETDAATILVLAVLCWQFGKAGGWIVAAGLMRYAFVLAARLLPWLRQPLPRSRRRQTVCILQSAGLLAVLSPLFVPPFSSALAFATLIMLATSFAIDVRWLWRRRRPAGGS